LLITNAIVGAPATPASICHPTEPMTVRQWPARAVARSQFTIAEFAAAADENGRHRAWEDQRARGLVDQLPAARCGLVQTLPRVAG
jgi:hypothetical protein